MTAKNQTVFNKANLLAIPAPVSKERETYYDAKDSGLALRVTRTGTKTFVLIRKIAGKTEWMTLGKFPDMTVEQAVKKAIACRAEIHNGTNPAEVKRTIREEETFLQLFDDFLNNRRSKNGKPLAAKTITGYQSDWRNHLSKLARKKISQVSESDIAAIYNKLGERHPTAANRIRALASSLFSHAIETKRVKTNPVDGIRKRFAENKIERYLGGDEIGRFFAALETLPALWKTLFTVSILTGIRRENVLAMRWGDIDLERGLWWLDRTKGDKAQNVALPSALLPILESWRSECLSREWVFPSADSATGHIMEPKKRWAEIFDRDELNQIIQRLSEQGASFEPAALEPLSKALKRAREDARKCGVDLTHARMDHTRIHDLRHTAASWMINHGATLAVVGKSLNHSSLQTTMRYAHLETDAVRHSKERATAAMLGAAGVLSSAAVLPLKKSS